jgi:hypothetical protein
MTMGRRRRSRELSRACVGDAYMFLRPRSFTATTGILLCVFLSACVPETQYLFLKHCTVKCTRVHSGLCKAHCWNRTWVCFAPVSSLPRRLLRTAPYPLPQCSCILQRTISLRDGTQAAGRDGSLFLRWSLMRDGLIVHVQGIVVSRLLLLL